MNQGDVANKRHRSVECLAVIGAMGLTPVSGSESFTSALVWSLEALVKERVAGRFTTEDPVKKILQARHFPYGQTPEVFTRNIDSSAGRIILSPLQKADADTPQYTSDSRSILSLVDPIKQSVLTLHFEFIDMPTAEDKRLLEKELNSIFERNVLGVNGFAEVVSGNRCLLVPRASFRLCLKGNATLG